MVTSLIHLFYPKLEKKDIKKFSLLGITFFLIIGAYWTLRLLKDTVIFKIAFPEELGWAAGYGRHLQPILKFWSPFFLIAVILIYSKLVDLVKKHKLFYIISGFYGLAFTIIGTIFALRAMYGNAFLGKTILAATGWLSYFTTESFGSVMPALFWSFAVSISDTNEAKSGFPFVIACAQIGAIGGSALLLTTKHLGGVWPLYFVASFFAFAVIAMIYYFMKTMPAEQLVGNKESAKTEKQKEGFWEGFISGLKLLLTRPYLIGVFVVSTFYEIISQIVDYQMKAQVDICPDYCGEVGFATFQAIYGMLANSLAFIIALLGTSYIINKLGTRVALLVYPIITLISFILFFIYFNFTSPSVLSLLWATLGLMVILKGVSYAVNNPTKEMMYIPTSKDVKFKSKGWTDMFGGRMGKLSGARVSNIFKQSIPDLMYFGTLFSFGLIGVWMVAALFVGRKNAELIKNNEIIE